MKQAVHKKERDFLGTGLSIWLYFAILLFSVMLFLFWGGTLWKASREDSHIMRFVVSYLFVIPTAFLVLFAFRRLTWQRLITTTGTVWGSKLFLTALLYEILAPGTAIEFVAPKTYSQQNRPITIRKKRYRPQTENFSAGHLRGRVLLEGEPVEHALLYITNPPSGRTIEENNTSVITIKNAKYQQSLYALTIKDRLEVENQDRLFHTVRIREKNISKQQAIRISTEKQELHIPSPGQYQMDCGEHQTEQAKLFVFDHPYVTYSNKHGYFSIEKIPTGNHEIWVRFFLKDKLLSTSQKISIFKDQMQEISFVFTNDQITKTPSDTKDQFQ